MARIRDDLQALSGYHSPQVDVAVRLNTNEAPFAPPESFAQEVSGRLGVVDWNRYPDRRAESLRRRLAEMHEVPPEWIAVANGSNEVLQNILLAFGGPNREAVVFEPGYQMHAQIARNTGTPVHTVARDSGLLIDPQSAREAMGRAPAGVVFATSPNNPTGLCEPRTTVETMVEAAVDHVIVIDEAYVQFASTDLLDLVRPGSPVIVTRTFSKTWGLAGLRLGYAIADPEIVEALELVCLPYHVDSLKQIAGEVALGHVAAMDARVKETVAERERIRAGLVSLGLAVVPSEANFLLFETGECPAGELWSALVDRGVLVRDCSGWPGLAGRLRVTVGSPVENDAFLSALEEVLT